MVRQCFSCSDTSMRVKAQSLKASIYTNYFTNIMLISNRNISSCARHCSPTWLIMQTHFNKPPTIFATETKLFHITGRVEYNLCPFVAHFAVQIKEVINSRLREKYDCVCKRLNKQATDKRKNVACRACNVCWIKVRGSHTQNMNRFFETSEEALGEGNKLRWQRHASYTEMKAISFSFLAIS